MVEAAGQARDVVLHGEGVLTPGLAGELRWRSTVAHLPPAYVQQREGKLGAWVVREGAPVFAALPHAQAGRPVAVDWSPHTAVVDEGRFTLGLVAAPEGRQLSGQPSGSAQ